MKNIKKLISEKYHVEIEEFDVLGGALYVHLLEDIEKELTGKDTLVIYQDKGVYHISAFKHMRSEDFKSSSTFTKKIKTLDEDELLALFDKCYNKIVKENTKFWQECDDMLDELNIPQPFFRNKSFKGNYYKGKKVGLWERKLNTGKVEKKVYYI